ncbi:MAG: IS110 family transposase [Mediterranea sp.]|jgi:transposase|nr:IS110 family transposase [Mediterranea sp.]
MRNVCGLDVHKDSVFMCILKENGDKIEEKFSVLTPELDRLRDLLVSHSVSEIAMESTSIYWIPIWGVLCSDFDVKLVNPYFIKQLPGRKTDVKDAQWIATVLQKELIKGSFIPDPIIQELRLYDRRIFYLNRNLQRAEQAIDFILQRCNIRLSNYVSDIGGKSMQKVIDAIIQGITDPEILLSLVHKRTRNRHGDTTIKAALTGVISKADRRMIKFSREETIMYERQIQECYDQMKEICNSCFTQEIELLKTIPGVKEDSAMRIVAEIGVDMKAFLTASAIVGWAGLKPGNEESAGKIKGRKTLHGNKYLRVLLIQCAWAACRTKESGFFYKYHTLSKRMNHNKALLANARKLLVIIWNILKKKQTYVTKLLPA